jgi:hypothetical protein
LNYWGITVIDSKNIKHFRNIIYSLMNVYTNSPDKFTITGDYVSNDSKSYYDKHEIVKEELINLFNLFIDLFDMIISENGYLLHLGI